MRLSARNKLLFRMPRRTAVGPGMDSICTLLERLITLETPESAL